MLPLFVSYPIIKYVLRLEIQDFFGVATLMALIVFVQTTTLAIQILANFFVVTLPSCLKFKIIEETKTVANTAKIDTNQTDSKIVKFICGLFRKRAVGISESKVIEFL